MRRRSAVTPATNAIDGSRSSRAGRRAMTARAAQHAGARRQRRTRFPFGERGWRILITLASYAHTRHTKPLFDDDVRRNQLQRLNAFAALEVNLWWFATPGGHPDPPPYAVRYDLARWLWNPSISGVIFCIRCGTELRYERSERGEASRTARCRACSRGREDDWPDNSLELHEQGTWLLHCEHPTCHRLFAGRRQARYCSDHKPNRTTLSRRLSLG
jgi:hypothetical protein